MLFFISIYISCLNSIFFSIIGYHGRDLLDKIKFVIFDLDDTLIHSGIDYAAIRAEICKYFPTRALISNLDRTPILKLASQLKEIDQQLYIKAKQLIEKSEEESVERAEIMEDADKIPEILEQYKTKSAIYTNNTLKTVQLYFQKPEFQFLKYFVFLTRDDVIIPKPNPEGILTLLHKYNASKENSVYIGDSFIDAGAAREAGIRFILFDSRQLDLASYGITPFASLEKWSELARLLQ